MNFKYKGFKGLTIFDLVCMAVMCGLCFYIIFWPPIHGVADQGDFERVMYPCGISFIDGRENHPFYDYIQNAYGMSFSYPWDKALYVLRLLMLIPCTSAIYPTAITKALCAVFCGGTFYMPVLAAVMSLAFSLVCTLLLRNLPIKHTAAKYLLLALFVFIFFDGTHITAFNSLYGQAMMILGLMMYILACVLLVKHENDQKRRYTVFYFISCVMLLGAKLQCVACLPFMLLVYVYLWRKWDFWRLTAVLAVCTVWFGGLNYVINGIGLNIDTQYNSVFYGILKDSEDPEQDLVDLGLDPALAADAGKHAYLSPEEYTYPPRSPQLEEMFYSKMNNGVLIKYYITHPLRLLQGMEITANSAFNTEIGMGTYEEGAGLPPGESDYRFSLWNELHQKLPGTLLFIIPAYLIFIGGGLFEALAHKNRYAWIFLLIMAMGAIQFPMPYLGNGNADIPKQLYLFNLCFDIGLVTTVCYVFSRLYSAVKKRR